MPRVSIFQKINLFFFKKNICKNPNYTFTLNHKVLLKTRYMDKQQPVHRTSLLKASLLGAVIGLVLISVFLMGVHDPKPEWPRLWMLKPLVIVPIAGAMGGVFYHLMDYLRFHGGWNKIVVYVVSFLVFIVSLWLGIVLGLNGTMWN
jgi:hypothetical protein